MKIHIVEKKHTIHGCSQGQFFTEANMVIMFSVGYVVKFRLWRPNILTLFNLGWLLQHSAAAVLFF